MVNQELQLPLNFSFDSLDSYIYFANHMPLLSIEEEYKYAELFQNTGDLTAARCLVIAHLRYVIRVSKRYLGYGLPLNDLIQEGNIGLMKAIKRFNPKLGVRLVSFAVHWIKAEIHEFVLRNWRIVKIATTKSQRKLFFNLRQMKKKLGSWFTQEEIKDIACKLGVDTRDVLTMEQRLINFVDISYDSFNFYNEEKFYNPIHYLYDINNDPAYLIEQEVIKEINKNKLFNALNMLDSRSKDILYKRWLIDNKNTLHDLSEKYGVSAERIRQLEKNAIKKLRQYMQE